MRPRPSRASPHKRAAYRAAAKRLGMTLGPVGAPVPPAVKKLAAITLQRRQARSAIAALAKLGAQSFMRAKDPACDPAEAATLLRQSKEAWRLSRLIRRCTQSLVTAFDPASGQLRVRHDEACKFKLCPHCTRTKAIRRHHELAAAVQAIKDREPDARFILLTLTKPKSTADTLADSLRRLTRNIQRLLATPEMARIVRGYLAVIEINHRDGLYHDHSHLLLHVPSDYGPENAALWLPQPLLVRRWSALYATDRRLVVDVRFVRVSDPIVTRKTLAELGKYLTAPLSLFKRDPDQPGLWTCHAAPMLTLATATHRKRLMTCGGTLAIARRQQRRPRSTAAAGEEA